MKKPCDECPTRSMYARTFDMHISGEDCPYECEEYEHWKEFQRELNKERIAKMDKEKVVGALHCRAQDLMIDLPACDGCDYQVQMVNRMGCDFRRLCKDALALLKEQEEIINRYQWEDGEPK